MREYLTFDPTANYLGSRRQAYHVGPSGFMPWHPAADGRWHSPAQHITFAVEGVLLRIYDRNAAIVPTITEQAEHIAALEAELRHLRANRDAG